MEGRLKRALLYIGIGLVVLGLIIAVIQVLAAPSLAQWRDIVIIVIGFLMALMVILMAGLVAAMLVLVELLRRKLGPILDKANHTAETVTGTTSFVGERVVSPFIKASAAAAGARAAVQALFRSNNGR